MISMLNWKDNTDHTERDKRALHIIRTILLIAFLSVTHAKGFKFDTFQLKQIAKNTCKTVKLPNL